MRRRLAIPSLLRSSGVLAGIATILLTSSCRAGGSATAGPTSNHALAPGLPCVAGSSAAPAASARGSAEAPTPCRTVAECPATLNACAEPTCQAGYCTSVAKPGVLRCPLTTAQKRYQSIHPSERTAAGVCREGACIPRVQCAELCGEPFGSKLDARVADEMAACKKRQSGSAAEVESKCQRELITREDLTAFSRDAIVQCLLSCGYPEMKMPH